MKLFAVSDVHSFYDEFIMALNNIGFEKDNPKHLLVVCGDYFDRGPKSYEVLNYLMNLSNVILIKGNHEDLMEEMIHRGYSNDNDIHNGTYETFCQLFPHIENEVNTGRFKDIDLPDFKIVYELLLKPLYDKMVNYFETKNYVFVHGWVPDVKRGENWRLGNWYESRWVNGMLKNHSGYNPTGKTVVCGHYSCSYGWSYIAQKYKNRPQKTHPDFEKSFNPYFEKGIIAIDACTVYSGKVNIICLEDDLI